MRFKIVIRAFVRIDEKRKEKLCEFTVRIYREFKFGFHALPSKLCMRNSLKSNANIR